MKPARNSNRVIFLTLLSIFVLYSMPAAADPDPMLVSPGRIDAIAEQIGQAKVDETLGRIQTFYEFEGAGSWGHEWRELGAHFEHRGDRLLSKGRRDQAREQFQIAQDVYRLGYLPENYRTEERKSWARFAAVARKLNALADTPFVEEVITVDGRTVTVQLYLPPGTGPHGFVLYTGGVDGSKESGSETGRLFAEAGYATAAFDLVGTGELVGWAATPDSFNLHQAILDHYQNDPRFDFDRAGILAGSFGGYYAIQLANTSVESRLKVVVNHCGLVSTLFENIPPEFVLRNFVLPTPDGDQPRSFMRRIGVDPDDFDYDELAATFGAFSLTSRGVVGTGSPTLDTPILTVNGGRDSQLSPIADMQSVQDAAQDGELWVLGLAGHCAGDYMPAARPDMVRWAVCRMEGMAAADCHR